MISCGGVPSRARAAVVVVIDVHRRPLGHVANQPHISLVIRLRMLGPGESGHAEGDAPGNQRHQHQRVHAPVQQRSHVLGRYAGLPHLGRVPDQQGLPLRERRYRLPGGRHRDQVAHGEADRGPGRGVPYRDPAKPHRSWAGAQRVFPAQYGVEQVDGDPVGELGHGQGGELLGGVMDVERGPDLAAGPLEQVEPGVGLL